MEIERKFLVEHSKMPDISKCNFYRIKQGYFSEKQAAEWEYGR